jgi:hypothetical protein
MLHATLKSGGWLVDLDDSVALLRLLLRTGSSPRHFRNIYRLGHVIVALGKLWAAT